MSAPPPAETGPQALNGLPRPELVKQLLACLRIPRWANDIADRRPFAGGDQIYDAAESAAPRLTTDEIHSALTAHPRIGERSGTDSWSRTEQSGVDGSDDELATALKRGNEDYEHRFGHVYLVCASGRSGPELLEILRSRLDNDAETELRIIDDELRKIARLRLARLIEQ